MSYNPFAKNAAPRGPPNQNQGNSGGGRGFNRSQPQGNKNPFATQSGQQTGGQRQVQMNQGGNQGFNNRQQQQPQQQQQQIRFQDNQPNRSQQDNRGFQSKSGGNMGGGAGKGNPFAAGGGHQTQIQQRSGSGNPFAQGGQQSAQMDTSTRSSGGFQQPSHQQQASIRTNVNPFQQGFQAQSQVQSAPMNTGGSVFGFQNNIVNNQPPSSSQFGQPKNSFNAGAQPSFGGAGRNPFSAGSQAGPAGFNSFANRNSVNAAPKMQFTQQDLKELDVSSVLGNAGANKVQGIELNLDALSDEASAPSVAAVAGSAGEVASSSHQSDGEGGDEDMLTKALQERAALWETVLKGSVLSGLSEEPPTNTPYDLMAKDPKTGKMSLVPGRIPILPPSSYDAQ